YSLKYRYIVQSYKGRTQSLVAEKTDISKNRASRNFDLMINRMTFEQRSSSLVLHQMMSDHKSSDLAPRRQWCLLKITLQAPFLNVQKTFDRSRSSLGLYGNDVSSHQFMPRLVPQGQKASVYDNSDPVPPRQNVVPSAEKTDSSQHGIVITTVQTSHHKDKRCLLKMSLQA
ncbi:hypothetical protein Tco_0208528, partial [Tanacetum coccineum]